MKYLKAILTICTVLVVAGSFMASVETAPIPNPVVCPTCVAGVVGAAAVAGGIATSTSAVAVGTGVVTVASVPWLLAVVDDMKVKTLNFTAPKANENVVRGKKFTLKMDTFGLSSFWHLRTSELWLEQELQDGSFKQYNSEPVIKTHEADLIKNLKRATLTNMAREGKMEHEWEVPKGIKAGRYRLKYVSRWTVHPNVSRFEGFSQVFNIVDA
ncbi:hypothetical protein BKA69DRAFT_1124105 [Paraphysoderma sedebokerense]|nr:hypothetical protein BKA69DRAFT_1124105 [Paraphysoderma sedebokerense]